MFTTRLIILLLLLSVARISHAIEGQDILPPEQVFKLTADMFSADKVELEMSIVSGYHLYRDKFKFQSQTAGIELGEAEMPAGQIEQDAVFGEQVVYRDFIKISLPIKNLQNEKTLKLQVKYQGCADIGVCYPPQKNLLELSIPQPVKVADTPALVQLGQGVKALIPGLFNQELLEPEQAFQFFAEVKDGGTLHVSWVAAEGYYLYKDKLKISVDAVSSVKLGSYTLPVGETHNDPEFGLVEIYHQAVSADIPLLRSERAAQNLTLTAKFQGCADRGVCYAPMQTQVNLQLPALSGALAAEASSVPVTAPLSEQDQIVNTLQNDSLGVTLLSFFGFGLLLAFTPCIFPMIPILSGIIVGQGDGITTRKAFLLSLSYVLASAVMYTLFGVLAALFGSNLQAAFQDPWVIAAFSALFVLLSLSMFGFYNLELPQALQARVLNSSDKHRDGSYLGAAIMGALSSLIVGPCVAAPLAAALIFIGQSGDVLLGGSALFVMALGMGLPLLLIGTSAGKFLPKSGAWLNTTKAVFGVIMLAVAIWMLSRILPEAITQLLVALLLIMSAMFLNALAPQPVPATPLQKFTKGLGFIVLLAGSLEIIGLSAGSYSILQPLQGFTANQNSGTPVKSGLVFEAVHSTTELDARLKQAAAEHKPVMLDFYADWCVSCKEMEAYTFKNAEVQKNLAQSVLLRADVTENNQNDKALLKRFGLIGPPGIIFFAADGQEKTSSRVVGYQDAAQFLQTLQKLH
ncbi:protein-disulfide reductase DsbD [Methylomonas sp. AM2-LC]|uniref:protein-disulfide reductase DsbD n=1 Tax=Methylomonas sp. AM2-LC TaxID=3153301 RepID=UPI0032674C03